MTKFTDTIENDAQRKALRKELPAELLDYAQGYVRLCKNIIDTRKDSNGPGDATLWVSAYMYGPDLMQNFFFEQDPEKKLEIAEELLQNCKNLTRNPEPIAQQLGHLGEKLALGMKCFIGPNIDMVSQRSLMFISNDQKLEEACVNALSAYTQAASEDQTKEMFFHHNDILGAFQKILYAVKEKDFKEAQKIAEMSLTMCSVYMNKYPIAHKAHEFFAVVNFLLDSRVKGRLFGTDAPLKSLP